jgi:hypothetical protein
MTKLQASKYNTTAIVIPIFVALRAFYEGDAFPVACRQLGDVSHKDVRMYKYPTKVFTRKDLPPWAINQVLRTHCGAAECKVPSTQNEQVHLRGNGPRPKEQARREVFHRR